MDTVAAPTTVTTVTITYTNHRSETARRHIIPSSVRWGACDPYHREEQWLLEAWDLDKQAWRSFAMCSISRWDRGLVES